MPAQRLLGSATGHQNNPNLLPGCPIDCHRAPQQCPPYCSTEPNVLSAGVLRWVPTVSSRRRYPTHGGCPRLPIRTSVLTNPPNPHNHLLCPPSTPPPPFPTLVQNPIQFLSNFLLVQLGAILFGSGCLSFLLLPTVLVPVCLFRAMSFHCLHLYLRHKFCACTFICSLLCLY